MDEQAAAQVRKMFTELALELNYGNHDYSHNAL